MAECKHGNTAPDAVLDVLHDSQAGRQRHKCAVCAYERGYQIGRSGRPLPGGNEECQMHLLAPDAMMNELPESQGTKGRHKCCVCAYHEGYARGKPLVG